jgi:hypothetical protein
MASVYISTRDGVVGVSPDAFNLPASCPGQNYVITFQKGKPIVTSRYSGPVLAQQTRSSLICEILDCPSSSSTIDGVPVTAGTYETTAPGATSAGSCS